MMDNYRLMVKTYEQSRLEAFKQLRDEAERKMNYWAKRASNRRYLSKANELAAGWGDKVSYYSDVVQMLEGAMN